MRNAAADNSKQIAPLAVGRQAFFCRALKLETGRDARHHP